MKLTLDINLKEETIVKIIKIFSTTFLISNMFLTLSIFVNPIIVF